jgi:hypothetical protein
MKPKNIILRFKNVCAGNVQRENDKKKKMIKRRNVSGKLE